MNDSPPETPQPSIGRILVVDDESPNRQVLRDLLMVQGYSVREAVDGQDALAKVHEDPPDVILLDVTMPGIDGFEVCRRLSSDPATAAIPVLLVTALARRRDRLTGIESGARDFLSKPVDAEDLALRIRNALHAKKLYDSLQLRLGQLERFDRMREQLAQMVIHDLKSPLSGILGFIDLALELGETGGAEATRLITLAKHQTLALSGMVRNILDVTRLENGQMPLKRTRTPLRDLAARSVESLGRLERNVTVDLAGVPEGLELSCDASVMQRVMTNLVGNAVKYSPRSGTVTVSGEALGDAVRVWVCDTGCGIPPEHQASVFDKFFQAEVRQEGAIYSTGLGLTFCKLAVEAHGGEIGLESEPGRGSRFWVRIPAVGA